MGEVYRARDLRLNRDVAIKVLPSAFVDDPGRAARFGQEARAVAALSHPNVLAVYDAGVADLEGLPAPALYVVTELLEGETLAERLRTGPLPVRKAIDFAVQIARGLAAAHDKGIVHRDLKPANVFVTAAGHVKILDFGLARQAEAADAGTAETRTVITDAGTVLGTAGYMAPEQVRAGPLDGRADLFSLGVVLYEMLSGRRAFHADTPAETMTAILREDPPDLTTIRADLPPALERVVRHCLEKNPAERFQTARDVCFALETLTGSTIAATPPQPAGRRVSAAAERRVWAVISLALLGAVLWLAATRPEPPEGFTAPHRATVLLPENVRLAVNLPPAQRFAISPDGRQVAFIGVSPGRRSMLWLHSLDDQSARAIEGTDGAAAPFWAPDGRTLAFRQSDQMLKLDVAGSGAPVAVGPLTGHASWMAGPDGEDLILTTVTTSPAQGILTLPPTSGPGRVLTAAATPAEIFAYPTPLPTRRHFLFASGVPGDAASFGVYLGSVDSTAKRKLADSNVNVDHVNTYYASGYVLSARNQTIIARRFDLDTLTLDTSASEVVGPIEGINRGGAAFSVSHNGVLLYQPAAASAHSRLTLVNRKGELVRTIGDDAPYSNLELSPDGSQVALSVTDTTTRARDIWIVDVSRGVRSRVTFDPSEERSAAWSLDGKSLIYTSKGLDLYSKVVGVGAEAPFVRDGVSKDPRGWSANGQFFLYRASGQRTGNDLWVKPRDPAAQPFAFLATPFDENYGTFAPDARWITYVSDESGRQEVYATTFPSGAGKWQISTSGGSFPRWRRDGKEIVYLAADGKLVAVPVSASGSTLQVSAPEELFDAGLLPGPGSPFDMTADGQRFVLNTVLPSRAPPSLVVLYNWPRLIDRR